MRNYLYSIVIPHYNSPTLLQRMLDSIPQREDIQIIVIDDCSSNENIKKLQLCHHTNLEIEYLQKNQGPGHARNVGLKKAVGKWCLVVDADDLFAEKAFYIFDKYKDSDYDYLCYCIKVVDSSLNETGRRLVSDKSVRNYLTQKNDKTLLSFKYMNSVCWNKLVRLSFIQDNNICFDETFVTDDVIFNLAIGLKSNNYEVISDELYYFVENGNSITHKKKTLEREFLFFIQIQKRNGFFEKLGLKKYPFYRRTILYFPYMWKKHGLADAIKFFKMIKERKKEIIKARKAYLYLFE